MIEIIIDKMLFLRAIKGVKLLRTRFYAIMFLMQRQIKTFYDVVSIRRTVLQNENINQIDFCGGDVRNLSLASSFESDRISILAKYIARLVCQLQTNGMIMYNLFLKNQFLFFYHKLIFSMNFINYFHSPCKN